MYVDDFSDLAVRHEPSVWCTSICVFEHDVLPALCDVLTRWQVRDRATVALTLLGESTEAEEAAASGDVADLVGSAGTEEAKGDGPPKVAGSTTWVVGDDGVTVADAFVVVGGGVGGVAVVVVVVVVVVLVVAVVVFLVVLVVSLVVLVAVFPLLVFLSLVSMFLLVVVLVVVAAGSAAFLSTPSLPASLHPSTTPSLYQHAPAAGRAAYELHIAGESSEGLSPTYARHCWPATCALLASRWWVGELYTEGGKEGGRDL